MIPLMADTVYLLDCAGGKYYIGFTNCLHFRLHQHFAGKGAKFTQMHRPLSLLAYWRVPIKEEFRIWKAFAAVMGKENVGGFR